MRRLHALWMSRCTRRPNVREVCGAKGTRTLAFRLRGARPAGPPPRPAHGIKAHRPREASGVSHAVWNMSATAGEASQFSSMAASMRRTGRRRGEAGGKRRSRGLHGLRLCRDSSPGSRSHTELIPDRQANRRPA